MRKLIGFLLLLELSLQKSEYTPTPNLLLVQFVVKVERTITNDKRFSEFYIGDPRLFKHETTFSLASVKKTVTIDFPIQCLLTVIVFSTCNLLRHKVVHPPLVNPLGLNYYGSRYVRQRSSYQEHVPDLRSVSVPNPIVSLIRLQSLLTQFLNMYTSLFRFQSIRFTPCLDQFTILTVVYQRGSRTLVSRNFSEVREIVPNGIFRPLPVQSHFLSPSTSRFLSLFDSVLQFLPYLDTITISSYSNLSRHL